MCLCLQEKELLQENHKLRQALEALKQATGQRTSAVQWVSRLYATASRLPRLALSEACMQAAEEAQEFSVAMGWEQYCPSKTLVRLSKSTSAAALTSAASAASRLQVVRLACSAAAPPVRLTREQLAAAFGATEWHALMGGMCAQLAPLLPGATRNAEGWEAKRVEARS